MDIIQKFSYANKNFIFTLSSYTYQFFLYRFEIQVEISLNLNQKLLIDFCKNKNITVTGYSPLGKPGNSVGLDNLWGDGVIQKLTKKYSKTAAQIALRFIVSFLNIIFKINSK